MLQIIFRMQPTIANTIRLGFQFLERKARNKNAKNSKLENFL